MNQRTARLLRISLLLVTMGCAAALSGGCARTPETFPGDPQLPESRPAPDEEREDSGSGADAQALR